MKQAIAGISPAGLNEAAVMTVWPTIGRTPLGRWIGRRCRSRVGIGPILTVGNFFALLLIPPAIVLFFANIVPPFPLPRIFGRRYRLTNRRVILLHDRLTWKILPRVMRAIEAASVPLDEFDSIDIELLDGHDWYHAGNMIFRLGGEEKLRLDGVSRPESFRQTCLKTRQAFVGVREVLAGAES